jgi:hypothetical protein
MTAVVGVADGRSHREKKGVSLRRELKTGPDKKGPRHAEEINIVLVLVLVLVFRNGFSIKLVSGDLTGFLANSRC